MRYVRMLVNAALGSLLGSAFVTILVLQLNRHLPLSLEIVGPLYGRLTLFYGPHLLVGFYALLALRELASRRPRSSGWLSVRALAWEGTLVVAAAAGLMWANAAVHGLALDEDSIRRLAAAAGATTLCALLLGTITFVHYSFGRRGSRVGATLLILTLIASALFPLAARGWGMARPLAARAIDLSLSGPAEREGPQVTLVAVDGASLDYVSEAVADGRLPALGRMLEGGVSMHLETLQPTQPAPVWTTVATGKYPPQTGIRAAASYAFAPDLEPLELLPDLCFAHALVHFGILRELPHRSMTLRARPVWSILSSQGLAVGVVGWPVSAPAAPLRGFLITDRFQPGLDASTPLELNELGYPEDAVLRARAIVRGPLAVPAGSADRPPIARRCVEPRSRAAAPRRVPPAADGGAVRGDRSCRPSVSALRAAARIRQRQR